MRIVALEEHFHPQDITNRISPAALAVRGWIADAQRPNLLAILEDLREAGAPRVASMDESGITTQVLSLGGAGAELLAPHEAIRFARDYNHRLLALSQQYPDRFAGFAHLPMSAPEAAADELERAVCDLNLCGAMINGTTDGRFLDDPSFDPIFARAEALDVPLYLHPSLPPKAVCDAYYGNLPGAAGFMLSCAGFGWHVETGLHVLRLVLAGVLDRYPRLKLVIGHMGEGLPTMLDRADEVFAGFAKTNLSRGIAEAIRAQLWITTSGFFSPAPFSAAMMTFGVDRILFSVDYPFASNQRGVAFLNTLPVSPAERSKIAHENADALLGLRAL
jgi:predicted TIM-barrel fold metal-dependent hydrolase